MAEEQPFFEIYVRNNPMGGSVVYWGLRREFADPGHYVYTLQWAEAASADFIDVDAGTLIDVTMAIDPEKRVFAKELESYYRLKLVTGCGTYYSFPQQASGIWKKREWLIAREISRKEFLRMEKQVGSKGYLLKAKVAGEVCPECVDWDTGDVSKSACKTCYGTRFKGGYWHPFATYVDFNTFSREKQMSDQVGVIENIAIPTRMLGYPHISRGDVFVDYDTGRRFFIRGVEHAAELRGQPLIYNAELRLAPFTDPIYCIPIPEDPPVPGCPVEPPAGYDDPIIVDPEPEPEPEIPIAEVCVATPDEEEQVSSVLEPESSVMPPPEECTPAGAYGGGRNWIWYDNEAQQWVLSEGASCDAYRWYETDKPRTQYHQLVPYNTWNPVSGASPVPVFDIDETELEFNVTGAGSGEVNGIYRFQGTINGAYAYEQQLP